LALLFSIFDSGPDLGAWSDCWVSREFLHTAIPRKGSGSTTTMKTLILPINEKKDFYNFSAALQLAIQYKKCPQFKKAKHSKKLYKQSLNTEKIVIDN